MTYDDVARYFGVRRCEACEPAIDHERGQQTGGTIHWRDRRFTRAGLRNFLLLIAASRLYLVGGESWRRTWAHNVWAASVARKELHIVLPTKLSQADRARVRWQIRTIPNVPAAIRSWANRKEVAHDHSR